MLTMSFAYTLAPMRARAKCKTRRDWSEEYAERFFIGIKVLGSTRNYRFGGKPFCKIELTADPIRQSTGLMTEQDYIDEGLLFMEKHGLLMRGIPPRRYFNEWKLENKPLYVVCFNILEVF